MATTSKLLEQLSSAEQKVGNRLISLAKVIQYFDQTNFTIRIYRKPKKQGEEAFEDVTNRGGALMTSQEALRELIRADTKLTELLQHLEME